MSNFVVVILVLISTLTLRQRKSFRFSPRSSCSPFVPIYGISNHSVGTLVVMSVPLLLSWLSVGRCCLKRFMSEETTCLGKPFHDAIFFKNCNSSESLVGEQIL